MTNTEQLRQLLKNAIEEGFSAEDIEDLAKDIEIEQEAEAENEEFIDDLQDHAANTLADFLFEIGYFGEDADIDECTQNIYDSLQLVREGKLKVSVRSGCCGKCKKDEDAALREALEMLRKFF